MREGLLYDMIGRYGREDARERTVRSMQQRYHVDLAQAARVEATALKLLAQVQESWKLTDLMAEQVLSWAAGCTRSVWTSHIAATIATAPTCLRMPTCPDLRARNNCCWRDLVGSHRRKLVLEQLEELSPPWDERGIYLILILRLAVLLHRDRSETPIPDIVLTGKPRTPGAAPADPFVPRASADSRRPQDEIEWLRAQGLPAARIYALAEAGTSPYPAAEPRLRMTLRIR